MKKKLSRSENFYGKLFIAPQMIGLVLFVAVPLFFALYLCFFDWNLFSAPKWVGLENFRLVFSFDGDVFFKSVQNTGVLMLGIVPLTMAFSLGLAVLANRELRFLDFYKSALFMPMITSSVAIAMVWYWLFAPDLGLINYALESVGLHGIGWLTDPKWSKLAVILMTVWQKTGYYFIIFLAGLKGISRTYYEAAQLDGASSWQQFLHITLPQISPVTFFVFVMLVIDVFNLFGEAYVLTRGGPVYSTYTLMMYIYNEGMHYFNLGKASVASMVLILLAGSISFLQFRLSRKWVNYEN